MRYEGWIREKPNHVFYCAILDKKEFHAHVWDSGHNSIHKYEWFGSRDLPEGWIRAGEESDSFEELKNILNVLILLEK